MDECTSNNSKRLFSILLSYFDEVHGDSDVEHYESIECIVVNAETLFNEITRLFSRDNMTWTIWFQIYQTALIICVVKK